MKINTRQGIDTSYAKSWQLDSSNSFVWYTESDWESLLNIGDDDDRESDVRIRQ